MKKKVNKKKVPKKAHKKVVKKKVSLKRASRKFKRTGEEVEEAKEAAEFKNKYTISWDNKHIFFSLKAEKLRFYGSWRKTGFTVGEAEEVAFSVDIWAENEQTDQVCAVESLHYVNNDPRDSMKSLNADICACVNKWLYFTQQGKIPTIPELQKLAAKPVLHFSCSGALDRLIIQLKEYRDTCLRYGGSRACIIESDSPEDPRVTFQANFNKESYLLKGRVPPLLGSDTIVDHVNHHKTKKGREKGLPPTDNAQVLIEALQKAKDSGNKAQQRKLRAMLRRAGYRGGLRNTTKKK